MVYISIVTQKLIGEICNSQPVTYSAIRKRFTRAKYPIRIKELRSYYSTYLRNHGILAEIVDLLQGRIKKSVFVAHYLKIESIKELVAQANAITATIERELLS
jgi:intergrase/recombinase